MHDGIERYGVEVNPAKSLANFDVIVNGSQVPRIQEGAEFPYCGNSINTKTLEITKDRKRRKSTGIWQRSKAEAFLTTDGLQY